MKKYEEHYDKPLYRWKLLEDGAVVKSEPIYEYVLDHMWQDRYRFLVPGKRVERYVKTADLDRLVHNRVYSFNPDDSHAFGIIKQTLINKVDVARAELNKEQSMLCTFIEKNGGMNSEMWA